MRNFEEDFPYDVNVGVAVRIRGFRKDSYPTVTFGRDALDSPEREARIEAHQERVQRELHELG